MRDQKGITLLEVLLAIIVISLTVTAMIKSLDQTLKGQSHVRNDLRAAGLARSKVDALKDYSRQFALAGGFSNLTLSPMVASFGDLAQTRTAIIDNKAFTWSVSSTFVTYTAGVVSVTGTATKLFRFTALVTWNEQKFPRYLTQTVFVSDPSQ